MTDLEQRPRVDADPRGAEPGDGPGAPGGHDAVEGRRRLVTAMREDVAALVERLPAAPHAVRLRAGDVSIELEWGLVPSPPAPATPSAAVTPAAPPTPATPAAPPTPATLAAAPTAATPAAPPGSSVRSPVVGVFYRAPEPGAAPFVVEGDRVSAGQQVAIVEAMKLMLPVKADRGGVVLSVLVPDGEAVEYDQPLLELDPGVG
jgi:acetyl-CoA carboxylase biotin carboxyl carrier protein